MENNIKKMPLSQLGYGFIPTEFLPENENEYVYRNIQNRSGINYRNLSAHEIENLVRNNNTCDNWNNILVSDSFNPILVKNCKFYGLVRIAKLEPYFLSFGDLKTPVGLYNSVIVSCDFGDNVAIENVNYMSHCITGNEVIITNVNELVTTNHAKFGNGIVKQGESESIRIWLELCNENGGRRVMPFNNMQPGDAYLWSKYRDDDAILEKFKQFTEAEFKNHRGYYGKIGNRTVIKNTSIIKDCWIGDDAYIKGANKLKNLTINSGKEGKTQIGEGVELVNGIIGFGCRIFYGVKAVRFILANHSQLKYGARLINSYLGNNATISCCEVLNSLIFPAHEQHHNNSFLCAALIMGQSNIAAGATIGSNHNSRAADGEMIAGRGFWPGLCVSIKHNSAFASFTILAKGDYHNELNIQLPFSLVSSSVDNTKLQIMPAYWFMYNMYALARNSWKYVDRDKRANIIQPIEYNYLAPDTINEIFTAISIIETAVGKASVLLENNGKTNFLSIGKKLLSTKSDVLKSLKVFVDGAENSKRKVELIKYEQAYNIYNELLFFYSVNTIIEWMIEKNDYSITSIINTINVTSKIEPWLNIGGQLIPEKNVEHLKKQIKKGTIKCWDEVHEWYTKEGNNYKHQKLEHAIACLQKITCKYLTEFKKDEWIYLLNKALATKEFLTENIYNSRAKDYNNPYKQMLYNTQAEMDKVVGALKDNTFIEQEKTQLKKYKKLIQKVKKNIDV
jgi:Domain of unknown function (DUF4954)